ncbi:hypothetical protein Aph02nite_40350 [Actinoplanes philippinensis]|uniref:Uncharacterized conserved protein, contains predicted SAM-dependent methyltransferase domain n=1 Tax=Actinoplanes philippinensis TaxID=35752 RepID=A0A1I2GVX8_9ACTN|nr:L-histidine N(alpha)-methyltransferase [Actinoplanes philippinensis]GIE78085.1 hypothetical protein Aph02nite_40350 [Actinoplanes philippinensis]SFF20776.1 Uncharacterized conserved protein, contains predicted SAM-dependent methyltransferase domain [Actinoplanes philippinensis]
MPKPHFENPKHEAEFLRHLERRRTPLKFAFAGSATATHLQLAESEGYQSVVLSVEDEFAALTRLAADLIPPATIVEAGPGDGRHTITLLQRYMQQWAVENYLGLDFSEQLLQHFGSKFRTHFPGISMASAIWDFETGPTSRVEEWRRDDRVLALMVGHTVGNPEAPGIVLKNLRHSLRRKDFLLLSVVLTPSAEETVDSILQPYRTRVFENAALEPLRASGLPDDGAYFEVTWDGSAVIGKAILERPATMLGLDLEAGTEIECFRSYRFRETDVQDLLRSSGWSPLIISARRTSEHTAIIAEAR